MNYYFILFAFVTFGMYNNDAGSACTACTPHTQRCDMVHNNNKIRVDEWKKRQYLFIPVPGDYLFKR